MTEQEARETICPKYKAAILANFNKDYCPSDLNKIDDIKCDASDCMMWRWYDNFTLPEGHVLPDIKPSTTDGYCGLGGQR
jgi:hypothetical protein